MKIISFLFLILITASISSAQIPTKTNGNSAVIDLVEIIEDQSFTISKIYPNPVKESVFVEIQLKQPDIIQVKLYNILGSEVKSWEPISLPIGDQKFKLNLSVLRTGVYILKFKNSNLTYSHVIRKS